MEPAVDGAEQPGVAMSERIRGRLRRIGAGTAVAVALYLLLQQLWPTKPGIVVQGIIIGSLTALLAFALALTYKSNRVVNFAQADLGAVPAVLGVTLLTLTKGDNILQRADAGWPYPVAIALSIVAAIALGALVERLVIRRFSKAPRLILMVVTIGLAQILTGVGMLIPTLFDQDVLAGRGRPYPSPFDFSFTIDPVVFHGNHVIAVVMTVACLVALFAFLRYTNIGIAIRASAESADRASLLGVNVGFTQNVAWVVATVLATLAMLLRGGILGLPLGSAFGPSILLRALAAAVIGRMENFAVIFIACCGIGIVESAIAWNEDSTTLVDPVLFVILIAVLLVQRRKKESRVEDQATSSWQDTAAVRPIPRELARLPEVVWGIRGLFTVLIVVLVGLPLVLTTGRTNLASAVFIYAIVALSLVLLTGWAGEISLGQVAFMAIGAAVSGALNAHYGWDLTLTLLAAGATGAAAAVVIGLPALRIRGLFLAVSTMAFALATSSYLLNREYFGYLPDNLTTRVQRLPLMGRWDISGEATFYYVCLGVLGICLWSIRGIRTMRIGRMLVATRDNERAVQAFSVNPTTIKLTAFAMSGFFASLAGGLLVVHQQALGENVFLPMESIRALTMVVVGGLGSVPGALLGAVFIKSTEWFNTLVPSEFRALFTFAGSGAGLLFTLWFLPSGLGGLLYRGRDALLKGVADRRGLVVPSLVADTASERKDLPDLTMLGGSTELLNVLSLDVAYGQVQILFDTTLDVERGQVIALLGTNGAGKSTVLRAVSGLVAPRDGAVWFDGTDITGMAPHRIAELGLIQVPGGRGVFPSLTVAENLRVAAWMFRNDSDYVAETTHEVLELFPILRRRLGAPAATLSGGEQQMLALGMAFIARPKLLMIDELSLGLAPAVVEQLLAVVRALVEQGTTVILVEQSVNVALTVADTAYFMEKGQVRFRGPTAELLERPDILRSVFLEGAAAHEHADNGDAENSDAERTRTRRRATAAADGVAANGNRPVVLEVGDMSKRFAGVRAVDGVSFALHEGEVLGLIGPNGAGKTTLFDLISGFLTPDEGSIVFNGQDITGLNPFQRARLGLGRSFQDARLFGGLTVHQAIAVALDRELEVKDPVAAALNLDHAVQAERRLARRADELVELMGLSAYRDKFVSELSTGSRRVVDLACQIGIEPKVILFDEPSSGIAQRETEAMGPLLLRIRDETGASLLVIEHDMPLIAAVSDRILALDLGRTVVEGDADTVLNDQRVVASYLGATREVIERSGTSGALTKG